MGESIVGNAGKPRLFAMILDGLLAAVLGIVVATGIPGLGDVARAVVLVTVYLLYFLISEAIWSRTLGKRLCGLIVRKSDGGACGWPGAAARTVLRLVEVNPLLFGALPGGLFVMFSKRKQRIGDILAGTVVVRSK